LREMNRSSKSVLPVSSSLFTCSRSIERCKMTLPDRKSHVLFGPVEFSKKKLIPNSNTRPPHLGHLPSGCCPEKSTCCAEPFSCPFAPKSNSALKSSLSLSSAWNRFPFLLRKPPNGPTCFSRTRVSNSSRLSSRPAMVFQIVKSHSSFVHVKLLNRSIIGEPHFGHFLNGSLSGMCSSG